MQPVGISCSTASLRVTARSVVLEEVTVTSFLSGMYGNRVFLDRTFTEKLTLAEILRSASCLTRFGAFLFCFPIAGELVHGQEPGAKLQSVADVADVTLAPAPTEAKTLDERTEESEICRLVIRVDFQKTDNAAASRMRADIQAGVFADYAISETRNKRLRKYPKISVPVGRNRYRVWYGYTKEIRKAVLAAAAIQAPAKVGKGSRVAQVAFAKTVGPDDAVTEGKYPYRSSWWTVAKRYPNREDMVEHLSGGQHEGMFELEWLDSLTREELHALHSDDHEGKINWEFAVRQKEIESNPIPDVD